MWGILNMVKLRLHRRGAVLYLVVLFALSFLSLLSVNTPSVKAEVTPSLVATTTQSWGGVGATYQDSIFYAEGLWWIFYSSGTNGYYKTSADGETFSSATLVRTNILVMYYMSVVHNGSHVAYVFSKTDTYNELYFRMGKTFSNGSIIWSAAESELTMTGTAKAMDPDICFDSNDEIWIGYGEHYSNNTGFGYVAKNTWKNGSWNMQSGFPYKFCDTNFAQATGCPACWVSVTPLTNGKVYPIVHGSQDASSYRAEGNLWDGDSWEGSEYATEGETNCASICAVEEGDTIHLTYTRFPYPSGGVFYGKYTYGTGWESETQLMITGFGQLVSAFRSETSAFHVFWIIQPEGTGTLGRYLTLQNGVWDSHYTQWLSDDENATGSDKLMVCHNYETDEIGFLITTTSSSPYNIKFAVLPSGVYSFQLYGLYDEDTGYRDGEVSVTAYFIDKEPETFTVNGSKNVFHISQPLYFKFDLATNDREYWVSAEEYTGSIYIFNASSTVYTIDFIDLAGALEDYPFVTASRYINGTLHTVEKRKVDAEKKILMALENGEKYTVTIRDGASYVFGDLLMTSETTVTLTLKGIEFPQNVILAYRYVRLYAERHNGFTSISMLYQDLDENTDNVVCNVKYRNGTVAYTSTQYTNTFNVTWTSANENITYFVEMDATHNDYGVINYRATMYRTFSEQPWSLDFLGSIPGISTADLIPAFIILCFAGVFSKVNAYVAAFMATAVALFLTWYGWISIPAGMLVSALFLAIFMGLVAHKARSGT